MCNLLGDRDEICFKEGQENNLILSQKKINNNYTNKNDSLYLVFT